MKTVLRFAFTVTVLPITIYIVSCLFALYIWVTSVCFYHLTRNVIIELIN